MSTMRLKERPTIQGVALSLSKGVFEFSYLATQHKSLCDSQWVFLRNIQPRLARRDTPFILYIYQVDDSSIYLGPFK